ncbi:hypothetical protein [Sphingobium sp. YC-XJ3]|uniref:hypothetical protein n=1 Tax=Sphingobium sp. YC-XJ3 TaxID=3024245 RepID=UPI00236260F0|nr:hypothetical protein [Sphingobium sp. YC-XJ3]WDA37852.1 hypothetical protein PO876_06635 [Sphingobium sp. YC-XJ3]
MDATSVIDRYLEIGRARALTEEESMELEKAIRREGPAGIYKRWTLDDNRALLIAARKRGGLKAYAEANERTYVSCQVQLTKLKRQRRQRGIAFVGRFFYDGEIGDPSEVEGGR